MKKIYSQLIALSLMQRMEHGETLEALHKETGISKATLWRWREGKSFPQIGISKDKNFHDWYEENRKAVIERVRRNKYGGNYLKVLERDNFKCQNCYKMVSLCVHHKDGNKKNNDIENLITLCKRCHRLVHLASMVLQMLPPYTRIYNLAKLLI